MISTLHNVGYGTRPNSYVAQSWLQTRIVESCSGTIVQLAAAIGTCMGEKRRSRLYLITASGNTLHSPGMYTVPENKEHATWSSAPHYSPNLPQLAPNPTCRHNWQKLFKRRSCWLLSTLDSHTVYTKTKVGTNSICPSTNAADASEANLIWKWNGAKLYVKLITLSGVRKVYHQK